jgi:L-alanine-DL-glutamate epimerase-like enolase superfamily enzyme
MEVPVAFIVTNTQITLESLRNFYQHGGKMPKYVQMNSRNASTIVEKRVGKSGYYQIIRAKMFHVKVPSKKPFTTHLQSVEERESILIEMMDADGTIGVGECVAFTSPWYTEETVSTAWHAIEQWLMPLVLNETFTHPNDLDHAMSSVKGNRMAKASFNHALWDIYSKKMNQPLWKLIGGVKNDIEACRDCREQFC